MSATDQLAGFWSPQLIAAIVLNVFLQAVQIGAYGARIAGVQTGRIGTSISLFNLFVTASRFANMFYAPMLGSISDLAGRIVTRHPALVPSEVTQFEWQMRAIVFAGTLGTLVGALMLPTSLGLMLPEFAPSERHAAIGLWAATGGIAARDVSCLSGNRAAVDLFWSSATDAVRRGAALWLRPCAGRWRARAPC